MKGNQKMIAHLNRLLADELGAINQYIVQSEMNENRGFQRLHDAFKKIALEEMQHAEKLIRRIIFLEGEPEVYTLGNIRIGSTVEEQFENVSEAELSAINQYNEGIRMAFEVKDDGTDELLRMILLDEERHLGWMETQTTLISQMGLQQYLAEQTR